MDINLKSSVGRSFSATFDPITVQRLIDLAIIDAEQRVVTTLANAMDDSVRLDELKDDAAMVLQTHSAVIRERLTGDSYGPAVLEAYQGFLAEFKLLQSGAGSERACMESFMALCELLQGD